MSVFSQLQELIATALNVSPDVITQESTMDDIEEWDSLGHVHIMVAMEQAFDVYMDVDDFAEIDSVQAILDYLATENVE